MPEIPVIISLIQNRPDSEWEPNPPSNLQAITDFEQELDIVLPEDYRQLLLIADGGYVNGSNSTINLESLEGVLRLSTDDVFQDRLQKVLIIGDDGSGNIYFFDTNNRFGCGTDALILVPMSTPFYTDAAFVAPNLTEAISRVFEGYCFLDLLYPTIE